MNYRIFLFSLALAAPAVHPGHAQTIQPAPATTTSGSMVPNLIRYSGVALRGDGKVAAGQVSITFLIFKDAQGGEPLWAETQSALSDSNGHYEVHLGSASAAGVPSDLFANGDARWLEVQVAGSAPQPRVLIASVAYAMKAADATTLGGLPASAFALAGSAAVISATAAPTGVTPDGSATVTTPGGTAGYLPVYSAAATIDDSVVFESGTKIGIGTKSPAATLDVDGAVDVRGVLTQESTGTATTGGGKDSQALEFAASAYDSSRKAALAPTLSLQAEPTGNNSASTGATLNLLYKSGSATSSSETGFYLNPNGTVHFASGQTFPGTGTGDGTITGVTAGTGLTGGGTSGKITLSVNTGAIPTLAGNNTFTGSNVFVPSLYEDKDVNIDNTNSNPGNISPGLRFGSASGEGMSSKRTSGGNQYGLDLYTDYNPRMSISESGYIGMNVAPAEGIQLAVTSAGEAGQFENNSDYLPAIFAGNLYTSGVTEVLETYGQNGVCEIDTDSNLDCEGTLTGSAKNFKIDHPLDPANKYLIHASVESSELMNIYSGNATTDASGSATVTLPDWFEAENGDFRYQLTTIGQDAHAWISQELSNRQFKIATNATNVKVSWQITAVRQDGYAKAHPLVAEQTKPDAERGLYRNPEAYGQPKEKGLAWARNPEQIKQSIARHNASKLHAGNPSPAALSSPIAPQVQAASSQPNAQ